MPRVVLLVTSPRIPAGVLSAQAWDLVRAYPVKSRVEGAQTAAIRAAGGDVEIMPAPTADALLAALDEAVVWLAAPDGDERLAREIGLKLAANPQLAELELVYGSWDPPGARLLDAVAVTDRLHVEDAWRRVQTHETLARYLLEEAYEAYDAILAGDLDALRGEMGDVLLQVLLHARIAEERAEDERWTVDDVAGEYVAKMIRRNPHIFEPGRATDDIDEIIVNWNAAKAAEGPKRHTSSLARALATLAAAAKDEDGVAALREALGSLS
ncbi:MazG nucleotide pyrophosphohydrolase domain-containing protein [Hamadaea tsunoensis]|uniref:MazG nucleotide pyrophosphohydrolase domain-containing protein n=1 Tax=Hamadaea tsunoensis TaxID=53368 RepID=UPI000417A660